MGVTFYTAVSFRPSSPSAFQSGVELVRSLGPILDRWFDVDVRPREGWDSFDVAPPRDYTWLLDVNGNPAGWKREDRRRFSLRLRSPDGWGGDAEIFGILSNPAHTNGHTALIPRNLGDPITALFFWDGHFCKGTILWGKLAFDAYTGLLEAARDELGAVWIADGIEYFDWVDERNARIVYYLDPLKFVGSFLSQENLEGDAERVLDMIRRLERQDYFRARLLQRSTGDFEEFEIPRGPLKALRPLRFTPAGGIILEEARYGIGEHEPDTSDYYFRMRQGTRRDLREALLEDGIVQPQR